MKNQNETIANPDNAGKKARRQKEILQTAKTHTSSMETDNKLDKEATYRYIIDVFFRYAEELCKEIANQFIDTESAIAMKYTEYSRFIKDVNDIYDKISIIHVKENIIEELSSEKQETIEKIKKLFYELDEDE